jgi:hypothetical protein
MLALAVPLALFAVAISAGAASMVEIRNPWPPVAPFSKTFHIPDAHNASVVADIESTDGKRLYQLTCHDGDYVSRAKCYRCSEDSFPYAGLLQCRLVPIESLPFSYWDSDALAPYFAGDGQSRAIFTKDELVGKCADYPGWGRIRHFTLRGMQLTLSVAELEVNSEGDASSYRFSVDVEPDVGAISAITGPSQFAEPEYDEAPQKSACDKVITQHVPGVVSEAYIRQERLGPPYPKVRPLEKTLTFSSLYVQHIKIRGKEILYSQPKGSELGMAILGEKGEPVYDFRCSNAGFYDGVHLDSYGFACAMHPHDREINLLADSVDPYTWENRAAFDGTRTWQTCGHYPEWGRVRHFELRGMRLTVSFEGTSGWGDIEPGFDYRTRPEIKGPPKIHVKVEPDPAASAPVAMPSRYVDSQFTPLIIDGQFVGGNKINRPVRSSVTGEIISGQVLTDDLRTREAHAGIYISADRCIEVLTHESVPYPSR